MDGHEQRQALTAAERSIEHLVAGRPDDAERAARRAEELDQVGVFEKLVTAVGAAASDLTAGQPVSAIHVDDLLDAVGPGPLAGSIEQLR